MIKEHAAPISTAALMERLRGWLPTQMPGACDLDISDPVEPAQGSSSRTILFKLSWREQGVGHERDLVARIQREAACPLQSDVLHQYRTMAAIADAADVAVPRLVLAQEGAGILGAPFFLMERVEGRVPADFPSYHAQGWFAAELTAPQRERAWWNAIAEMAKLHRIGWQHFSFMAQEPQHAPDAGFYLEHFVGRWLAWAAQGEPYPLLDRALRHLLEHRPSVEHAGLVWNDARMGNTMFAADLRVASLLDFEVATLGPAEIDLAWWLYAEDLFSLRLGHQRIAGIPDREAAIRGFERLYGRPMPHFEYYEAIAALKHAVISIRDFRNGKSVNRSGALLDFATQRLSRYLDSDRRA